MHQTCLKARMIGGRFMVQNINDGWNKNMPIMSNLKAYIEVMQ